MTNDEASNLLRLHARYLRAKSRNNTLQTNRIFDEIWELMGDSLVFFVGVHKFANSRQPKEDLVQSVRLGLYEALAGFDTSRGQSLFGYAKTICQRRLYDQLNADNGVINCSPYTAQAASLYRKYRNRLANELGRDATDEEILGAAKKSWHAQYLKWALSAKIPTASRVFNLNEDGTEEDLLENVPDPANSQALADLQGDLNAAWESWISILTPKQVLAFKAHFGDDLTYPESAEALGGDWNWKSVDNSLALATGKIRTQATALLAEQGLTIESATIDDLLALRFPAAVAKHAKTSKYKGVGLTKNGKWRAVLQANHVQKVIGYFDDEADAARAYDAAAIKLHGDRAVLNFPIEAAVVESAELDDVPVDPEPQLNPEPPQQIPEPDVTPNVKSAPKQVRSGLKAALVTALAKLYVWARPHPRSAFSHWMVRR